MLRFSVIVPLYNKERYVKKAIESVLAQTYRDFELIIVDDGSTDNSAAICEELLSKYYTSHNIHHTSHIIHQRNSGVSAARNRGVVESRGEFLCFLDADDWWEPTWLEEMDKLITEYPDAGLYATNYIYYKPGKTHVALNLERGYMNYPEAYLHSTQMPVTSITTCMPHRVFDEMGGFPVGVKLGEDFLLWAKTALHYKVAFCDKPLAYYNNDVPASMRATRNLHAPAHHMLFHLDQIEHIINDKCPYSVSRSEEMTNDKSAVWKQLLDRLRVSGMMDYWLSDEYHDAVAKELAKVDWSKQSKKAKEQYEKPIWMLKAKMCFMQAGSYVKQKMVKMLTI